MVEIRGWVGWSQMSFEDISTVLSTEGLEVYGWVQGKMQESRGPFCKCESWRALSQDLPALGCEAKGQLVASDWQLGCLRRWDKWVSGRGREVSTTERGQVSALWTGLSSPPSTLSESQSCLTLWSNDGPRPPSWPGWSGAPSKLCMQQSSRTPALSQPGAQLTDLKVGGGSGYGLKKFLRILKRKWGFCLWFHCVSLCTAQASPTLLALLCFPNRLMIISFDSCIQLFISATSCKPSDKWAVNCKVCVMFLWALFPATSPMPDT